MATINTTNSCGLMEINSIYLYSNTKELMLELCRAFLPWDGGNRWNGRGQYFKKQQDKLTIPDHAVYSGTVGGDYDKPFETFVAAVREFSLGSVVVTPPATNMFHPNRKAIVLVWTPDKQAVRAWWESNKPVAVTAPVDVHGTSAPLGGQAI